MMRRRGCGWVWGVCGAVLVAVMFPAGAHAADPPAPTPAAPSPAPAPAAPSPAPAPAAVAPPTPEAKYELAGSMLRVLPVMPGVPPREVALGCEGRGLLRIASKLHVACGAAGVVTLDLRDPALPVVVGKTPVDGEAVSVFLLGQRVWVEIARTEARPLEGTSRAPLGAAAPPALAAPAPPVEGAQEPTATSRRAEPAESRVAPPRVGDVWDISAAAQLFLPFGTIGFGALGEAEIVKRFEIPLSIHLAAKPVGYASGKEGGTGTAVGLGMVALDTQFLELGLGLGAATINDRSYNSLTRSTSTEGGSIVVSQLARIGARDGLAFDARSTIVVRKDTFQFGTFDGSMQVPIASRWHFVTAGGGGIVGYGYGHAGARYRLSDTTKAGAFAVTGSAGVAGIFGAQSCVDVPTTASVNGPAYASQRCSSQSYIGPALRVGLEWRL